MKFLLLPTLSLSLAGFALAQGSLTPPGAPAPTMKTLDQIESRTPISALPATISQSGSYYLTGNLSVATGNGIVISASNVTLDLNGFTISSTSPSASGQAITSLANAVSNVWIRNGNISSGATANGVNVTSGSGFFRAIHVSSSTASNIRISDLNIQGMNGNGIELPSNPNAITATTSVDRCSVNIAINGITADSVSNCQVANAHQLGINGKNISQCNAQSYNSNAISGNTIQNCYGISSFGIGIAATVATNCMAVSIGNNGLTAENATNCSGATTSGNFSIQAGTASFCLGRNPNANGFAISASIAIGCTKGSGTIESPSKHLGTP